MEASPSTPLASSSTRLFNNSMYDILCLQITSEYERLADKELEKPLLARLARIVDPVTRMVSDLKQKNPPMLRDMLRTTTSMKHDDEKKCEFLT